MASLRYSAAPVAVLMVLANFAPIDGKIRPKTKFPFGTHNALEIDDLHCSDETVCINVFVCYWSTCSLSSKSIAVSLIVKLPPNKCMIFSPISHTIQLQKLNT